MAKPTRDEVKYWTTRVKEKLSQAKQTLLRENTAELAEINDKAKELALKKCGVGTHAAGIEALIEEANEKIAQANDLQEEANEKVSLLDGGHNEVKNHYGNDYTTKRNLDKFSIQHGFRNAITSDDSDVGSTWAKNWTGVTHAYEAARAELLDKTDWGRRITEIDTQTGQITDAIMLATTSKQLSDTVKVIMSNLGLDTEGFESLIRSS